MKPSCIESFSSETCFKVLLRAQMKREADLLPLFLNFGSMSRFIRTELK